MADSADAPDPAAATDPAEVRRGTAYGIAAYGIWGVFPIYFHALTPSGPWEILAHRILWTLVFCGGLLLIRRDLSWVRRLLANRRATAGVVLAALLIAVNWVIYVLAVLTGRTYEAALGYFLNPLVTVALGMLVFGERLRVLQKAALATGTAAAAYLIVAGGVVPWISLSLALTFGLYGLMKKRLGATMDALHSLTAETLVLLPVAAAILALLVARGESTFGGFGAAHTTLLTAAGVVTAIPLLLFAAAARRVPLVTIGLLQYSTPVLQLICGVVLLHEHVSPAMWVGFGIVWVALALLATDLVRTSRAARV